MKNPLAKIDFRHLAPKDAGQLLLQLFTSYGLAAVVLIYLTVITLLGTLNQSEESLFISQKKYFESFWVMDSLRGIRADGTPVSWFSWFVGLSVLFFAIGFALQYTKQPRWLIILAYSLAALFQFQRLLVTWYGATSGSGFVPVFELLLLLAIGALLVTQIRGKTNWITGGIVYPSVLLILMLLPVFFVGQISTSPGLPVFLPGGALLMGILFFNLLLGTSIKIRRKPSAIGLYLSHFGILLMIFSGLVTMCYSWEGNVALFPGMKSREGLSFHHWQLEVIPVGEDGKSTEALVIPHQDLNRLGWNHGRKFTSSKLPFHIEVKKWAKNAEPELASRMQPEGNYGPVIDGYTLQTLPLRNEAERNAAGGYVDFVPKNGDPAISTMLSVSGDGQLSPRIPYVFTVGGKKFAAQIVREALPLPFDIRLDEFKLEKYSGVDTAKNYQSNVTKIDDGVEEKIEIKMNEPLRHEGYTFFQTSFGPEGSKPGDRMYSVFTVVKNPSDHWPLISLIIVGVGLLIHLVWKLVQHQMGAGRKKTPTPPQEPTPPNPA